MLYNGSLCCFFFCRENQTHWPSVFAGYLRIANSNALSITTSPQIMRRSWTSQQHHFGRYFSCVNQVNSESVISWFPSNMVVSPMKVGNLPAKKSATTPAKDWWVGRSMVFFHLQRPIHLSDLSFQVTIWLSGVSEYRHEHTSMGFEWFWHVDANLESEVVDNNCMNGNQC